MNKKGLKIIILLVFAGLIAAFYILGGHQYINLDTIKQQQNSLVYTFENRPVLFPALFFIIYVACTALSLPIAALLTLLAGAIFGFFYGLVVVSFASTLGATIAFLMSRFIFQDTIQERYKNSLKKINEGFEKEGTFYLFALRLVPVFPFFMVNLVMGLLPIKTRNYYLVSQAGMLPGTAVYVYAGTELAKIDSLSDITSPGLLIAFALLGVFPIIARKSLALLRAQKSNNIKES